MSSTVLVVVTLFVGGMYLSADNDNDETSDVNLCLKSFAVISGHFLANLNAKTKLNSA